MPRIQPSQAVPIRIAVQGTGNWGRNLVRVFSQLEGVSLTWIIDPHETARAAASRIAPHAKTAVDIKDTGFSFDAAVIATPAALHAEHVAVLLSKNKHVLVEKPAAMSEEDAATMCRAAQNLGLCLMVGHQLLFHPVFLCMKQCIEEGLIGQIHYIYSRRTGPLDLAKEPGVVWSYGPHDVAMITALLDCPPLKISAHVTADDSNLAVEADIRIAFANDVIARIELARLPDQKIRELTVTGEKGTLIFDDSRPGGNLTFKDNQTGSTKLISTTSAEALQQECAHFAACICSGEEPITGSNHLQTVARILCECTKRHLIS